MPTARIAASGYSNTAPLVWSFLYGSNHGKVELILDNAPARSAELLAGDRVDAALVPVICAKTIADVHLIPDVCVGAREKVRSVCVVTRGADLRDVSSVALDVSSKTSVVLTKIIFREFLGFEPEWHDADPDLNAMLAAAEAALIIGDPALKLRDEGGGMRDEIDISRSSLIPHPSSLKVFDLADLWHQFTGLGFIFAMWMTRRESLSIDFAAARDEGLKHIDEIAASYAGGIGMTENEMHTYLTEHISFTPDASMLEGMELYFELAAKHGLIDRSIL